MGQPDDNERPYPGVYHDPWIGLAYVHLENGVSLGDYHGEETICIHDVHDLWDLIAAVLVKGWRPLHATEARHLRRHLDLAQEDLAAALGVSRASVARWEANLSPAANNPPADLLAKHDRALRLYAAAALGLSGVNELLREDGFGTVQTGDRKMLLRLEAGEWTSVEDTFGADGGTMEDPRRFRRWVCRLKDGDPYGDEICKKVVARFESWSLAEAKTFATEAAHARGIEQWSLDDCSGRRLMSVA
jgi:transcriptional regulator with XRE-family HTH domain